jgi:hypothetical protein
LVRRSNEIIRLLSEVGQWAMVIRIDDFVRRIDLIFNFSQMSMDYLSVKNKNILIKKAQQINVKAYISLLPLLLLKAEGDFF